MDILVPFSTRYLCELGFSILETLKMNHGSQIDFAHSIRIALTYTDPNIARLIEIEH